jgi:hypothetical protein
MQEDRNGDQIFPLDDAGIAMISELDNQRRAVEVATQAVVMYFAKQQGLMGEVQIAANRRELILKPLKQMPQGAQI